MTEVTRQLENKNGLYADVHPHDIINQAKEKLSMLQTLIYFHDPAELDLLKSHNDGLYFMFNDIIDGLEAALQKL